MATEGEPAGDEALREREAMFRALFEVNAAEAADPDRAEIAPACVRAS